jgi:serine/threonine protein phosphatase 1
MFIFEPTIEPGDVIAVGDLHARYDLLEQFLNHVRGSEAIVIFLGDIIDRGGQDLAVLDKMKTLLVDPESEGLTNVFCLMGNHEAMFVDAITGSGAEYLLWLQNGANFEQYGEMQEHLEWVADLPVYMTIGETMFIHAGFYPGKNPFDTINSGKTDNILWMREPFLTYGPEFEKWNPDLKQVVFGHTPSGPLPYAIPNGICIDTGAYFTNILTSYNVTRNTFTQYNLSNVEATSDR